MKLPIFNSFRVYIAYCININRLLVSLWEFEKKKVCGCGVGMVCVFLLSRHLCSLLICIVSCKVAVILQNKTSHS